MTKIGLLLIGVLGAVGIMSNCTMAFPTLDENPNLENPISLALQSNVLIDKALFQRIVLRVFQAISDAERIYDRVTSNPVYRYVSRHVKSIAIKVGHLAWVESKVAVSCMTSAFGRAAESKLVGATDHALKDGFWGTLACLRQHARDEIYDRHHF